MYETGNREPSFEILDRFADFYDVDICLQALQRGYKVTTVPVVVKHDSEGIPPKNFNDYRKVCFEKWNARIDAWPISRLTKFHEPEAKDVSRK